MSEQPQAPERHEHRDYDADAGDKRLDDADFDIEESPEDDA